MRYCDYHVMEYTCSELQLEGTPFAIVLYLAGNEKFPLQGFVLKCWENMFLRSTPFEVSQIKDFLSDLEYYSQETEGLSGIFFRRLDNLNVGPIRTLASGACVVSDLDKVISTFFSSRVHPGEWRQFFDSVKPFALLQ